MREDLRFVGRFLLLGLGAWMTYATFELHLLGLATAMGSLVAGVGSLVGLEAAAQQGVVTFGGGAFRYEVTLGCTALYVGLLFAAGVLAYPARWPQRAVGLLAGLPFLFIVNVARLVSMGWIGVNFPERFEDAHVFWWQAIFVLLVGLVWLAWVRLVVEARRVTSGRAWREIAAALLVFAVTLAALAVAGARTGASATYRGIVGAAATLLARDAQPGFVHASAFAFAGLASTLALFLATPRLRVASRLGGFAAWGAPVAFLASVLLEAARTRVDRPGMPVAGLVTVVEMMAPFAAWAAWAARQGVFSLAAGRDEQPPCPACGRRTRDVLAHVQTAHRRERRGLTRTLLRDHPRLAAPRDRKQG